MLYRKLHKYKYQLTRRYKHSTGIIGETNVVTPFITLRPDGTLVLKKGYSWDGATCAIDTKSFMRGSLVHDALYQLIREKKLNLKLWRSYADELLRQICIEDGMHPFRANYVYWAVKVFGKLGVTNKPQDAIYEV